jgi:hypothetical protein
MTARRTARRMRESEIVEWRPQDKDLISHYVDSLMEILSIGDQGQVETTEIFELDIFTKILAESVILRDISTTETKRALIKRAALLRLKKYKQQSIYTFRRALAAEVRGYLTRPVQKYWILLPLHIPSAELGNLRSISILGTKLLFRDWDYVQRRFDIEAFVQRSAEQLHGQDVTLLFTAFSPVLVLFEGRSDREALDKANRPFDLLRCLINLGHQFGRFTRQWGGYPKPLATILPPPTYGTFTEEGSLHMFFYNLVRYEDYGQNTLRGGEITEVRRLANRLKEPDSNNQTMGIFVEALEKYGEALDTFEWRLAFLLLWQILELITLQSSENLNMKAVKGRVNSLLNQDRLSRDLLSALYKTRNSLVHRGSFPDEEGLTEINLLKHIVEGAINALFSLLRICPTRANLERYYEHISAGDTELADRRRLIRNILWRRSR